MYDLKTDDQAGYALLVNAALARAFGAYHRVDICFFRMYFRLDLSVRFLDAHV